MPSGADLEDRLRAAGVHPGTEPLDAWRGLRKHEGATTTVIDLYELVARRQGLRPEQLPSSQRHELARAVMPEVWPGWITTPDSERRDDLIELVDYDPTWPDRYLAWEGAIHDVLGPIARRVEHVGSTSVPGLSAKPIVDVQVSVADLEAEPSYVAPLRRLGLRLRSRDTLHRYFRPDAGRPRDVHVHVCPEGSAWEQDHLLFRDHLRTHPEARAAYTAAKRAAVALWADDGIAYTEAKTAAVLAILDQARKRQTDPMTPDHTRHLGVRIDRPAADVYDFVRNPANLPSWAPGLATSVTQENGESVADSPMGRVTLAFVPRNEFGVLDHEVTLPTGDVVLNPMRAIPDGMACDVVFTLRRQPGMSDDDVERDAAAVTRDLGNLKRILER